MASAEVGEILWNRHFNHRHLFITFLFVTEAGGQGLLRDQTQTHVQFPSQRPNQSAKEEPVNKMACCSAAMRQQQASCCAVESATAASGMHLAELGPQEANQEARGLRGVIQELLSPAYDISLQLESLRGKRVLLRAGGPCTKAACMCCVCPPAITRPS